MTEPPRRKRWSPRRLRVIAWLTGIATFFTGSGVLGLAPTPSRATGQPDRVDAARRPVVIRRITRRIVIVEPAASAPVTYVPAPSTGSTDSGAAPAPAPAPAPPPSTGGS